MRLLEREREIEAIQELLACAAEGEASALFVQGEPGIGKTTLLRQLAREARQRGFTVLRACGGQLETDLAFGVVRQLYEPVLVGASRQRWSTLLTGPAVLALPALMLNATHESMSEGRLASLVPLPPDGSGVRPAPAIDGEDPMRAVMHGLYWLTANLAAEVPLLLIVDDYHWADQPSRRLLDYLANRLDGLGVVLTVAVRSGHTDSQVRLAAGLGSGLQSRWLRLRPLSIDAAETLVVAAFGANGDTEFAAACHQATGGNPLLLCTLLRELSQRDVTPDAAGVCAIGEFGAEAVGRVALACLARCGSGSQRLAQALAVLGDSPDVTVLAQLCQMNPAVLDSTAQMLVGAGVLRPGSAMRFVHPLTRCAVYEATSVELRVELHTQAAQLLADRSASVEQIAHHLAQTPPADDDANAEWLARAAESALRRGAPENASAYAVRGLAENPAPPIRLRLLIALGTACLRPGGSAEAIEHLSAALQQCVDDVDRYRVTIVLAHALVDANRYGDAVAVLQDACARVSLGPEPTARLHAELYAIGQLRAETARATAATLATFIDAFEEINEPQLAAALAMSVGWRGERASEVIRLTHHAYRDAYHQHAPVRSYTLWFSWLALAATDAFDYSTEMIEIAVGRARRSGWLSVYSRALAGRTTLSMRLGRISDALADGREAVDVGGNRWGPMDCLPVAFYIDALVEADDPDAAENLLRTTRLDGSLPPLMGSVFLLYARGRLRLARGQFAQALADFTRSGRLANQCGLTNPAMCAWARMAALAQSYLGHGDRAVEIARRYLSQAQRWGADWTTAAAWHTLGWVRHRHGDPAGIDDLRRAVSMLTDSPAQLSYMEALADCGIALGDRGECDEARRMLAEAAAIAEAGGATRIARRVSEALNRLGTASTRVTGARSEALTPAERRVAGLAAEGKSNRSIAQQLYITLRAVELHLTHTYRKLNITGRAELAGALGGTEQSPLQTVN